MRNFFLTVLFSSSLVVLVSPASALENAFVIDESDATLAPDIKRIGIDVAITPTVMKTLEDKQQLARFTLGLMEFQV